MRYKCGSEVKMNENSESEFGAHANQSGRSERTAANLLTWRPKRKNANEAALDKNYLTNQ
jgi:hypothetical protein